MFTDTWLNPQLPYDAQWHTWFDHLAGRRGLSILEVGSFEGRSTRWWLDNLMTDESARIWCVDTWEGSPEHRDVGDLYERFVHNVGKDWYRVEVMRGRSFLMLVELHAAMMDDCFDLVYIDGSHDARDVLSDAVLVWPLLRHGGYVLFDDNVRFYDLGDEVVDGPGLAVQKFLDVYERDVNLVSLGQQALVRKR